MSATKAGVVGVYVIGIGLIGYDLGATVAPNIEAEIASEIGSILPNGTRHGAMVVVEGRDIQVSGTLHDHAEREALLGALRKVPGHRVVRLQEIKFLPVASPYSARLEVSEDGRQLKTSVPDEIAAAELSGMLPAEITLSYGLASGLPGDDWFRVLSRSAALSEHLEAGSISLSDHKISIAGSAHSRMARAAVERFAKEVPGTYSVDADNLSYPQPYSLYLSKADDGSVSVSGALPKSADTQAVLALFSDHLGNTVMAGTDFNLTADGDLQDIGETMQRLTPLLNDLKTYSLALRQEADLPVEIIGKAKPSIDLDDFAEKRAKLGFQTAEIEVPGQFDVEFRLDARTGAELAGIAPEGFDPEQIAANLGLPEINLDNFDVGARGSSETLTEQISSLKPVLEDVETLTVGLEGKEGQEAPAAQIKAETLPNVDPSRVAALLSNIFTAAVKPDIAPTKTIYENGQIRVNGITGIKEQFQDGYWIPIVTVTNASAGSCRKVTDSILSKDQIEFASGRAELDPSARVIINKLAGVVSSCFAQTALNVELAGHTDAQGDADTNLLLSILRVNSVRDALVERGITFTRILTVGYGENRPIADNDTPEGRSQNRRTEFAWIE